MFFGSYDLEDFSGNRSGEVKKMVEVGMFFGGYVLDDSSGGFPEKVHTLVGLFFSRLLIYFSVLYHTIGEISGKVKIMVKLE
jgi:hypothetical protein